MSRLERPSRFAVSGDKSSRRLRIPSTSGTTLEASASKRLEKLMTTWEVCSDARREVMISIETNRKNATSDPLKMRKSVSDSSA